MNLTESFLREILKQAFQLGCVTPAEEKDAAVAVLIERAKENSKEAFSPSKAESALCREIKPAFIDPPYSDPQYD
jgi:hypothetical protein